jgi:hypothetical protein
MDEQKGIIDRLELAEDTISKLRTRQRMTMANLDALLPAILEKAFNGSLSFS